MRHRVWLAIWIAIGLAGCAVSPRHSVPLAQLPAASATAVSAPSPRSTLPPDPPTPTATLTPTITPLPPTPTPAATATRSAPATQTATPRPMWTAIPTNTPPVVVAASATAAAIPTAATPPVTAVLAATAPPAPATAAATATITRPPSPTVPAPPVATPTTALMLADLVALPDGATVTLIANVVASASFAQGFKFTLADESGRAVLLMWHNVYDDCWDRAVLNIGARVLVSGEVQRFNGELQIEPQWGGGVQVLTPAYAWATAQRIADLAAVDGQRALIDGQVTALDVGSEFTRLQLADESGSVEIFIWANIWQRVAQRDAIAIGTPLRVVGTVGRYRGTLQLVPALPVDVVRR